MEINQEKIDIASAFENVPPVLDQIWPGFLAGTVGALVAPGGSGKSFWALLASMSIAAIAEGSCDLIGLSPQRSGRVMYFAAEDPAVAIIRRIHSIGKLLDQSARALIARDLSVIPLMGSRLDIMDESQLLNLIERCKGHWLVVFDTLSRIHRLDENSNSDMAALVSTLEHLAKVTGAAVLFLHHANKASARDGQSDQQHAARGASSLVDNSRWCGFISRMSISDAEKWSDRADGRPIGVKRRGSFLRYGGTKHNYSAWAPDRWYKVGQEGVLEPVHLSPVTRRPRAVAVRDDDDI